jgi:pyruvate kinase
MEDPMLLPRNKTKIVCTIGPASSTREVMEDMIHAGMDVARLNFSHGDFESHDKVIENLRKASSSAGKQVAIMADLSGPKMRIGELEKEPIELRAGDAFTLTAEETLGNEERVSVSFSRLPRAVSPGDMLFLNDGYVQLEVREIRGKEVMCLVVVGGELRSRKGLNLPGINLGIGAFTERDRECLEFALAKGVDAVSQSFVERASDIHAVREAIRPTTENDLPTLHDIIALSVETTVRHVSPAALMVPTRSGATARSIARFRLPVWITAVSSLRSTCQNLQFSYGVHPVHAPDHPEDWKAFSREWLRDHGLSGNMVILTEGPSSKHPEANNRMEIIDLRSAPPPPQP